MRAASSISASSLSRSLRWLSSSSLTVVAAASEAARPRRASACVSLADAVAPASSSMRSMTTAPSEPSSRWMISTLRDELVEHAVLGRGRVEEVVAADLGLGLERAVDAAVALLHARGVPGDVEVEEVGAVALEVHALAGGVGGDEDADGVLVGRGVEGALHLLARSSLMPPWKLQDALVAAVGVRDGGVEELDAGSAWCRRTR